MIASTGGYIFSLVIMNSIVEIITRHGYSIVFLLVFAESVGLPIPAALAMVAAGAAAASGAMNPLGVLAVCISAMLLGDLIVYSFGRKMGWWLLALLCKVSMNPETCILRSAESFYKRGKTTLVIAKFIPGISAMAAPLAGSMKMRLGQFLWLDLSGALLYGLVYTGLGYVFHNFVAVMMTAFQRAGHAVETVVLVAVVLYIAYRIRRSLQHRIYRVVPRVEVDELTVRLLSEEGGKFILADVRSHGYYDAGADRIRGSIRIEPNNLAEVWNQLPRDQDIYLYCT